MRGRPLVAALAACAVLGGCDLVPNEDEQPPPVPTAERLDDVASRAERPAYWLGARHRGLEVSSLDTSGPGIGFGYGDWYCSPGSGCSNPNIVSTGPRDVRLDVRGLDPETLDPQRCWSRVGRAVAVLLACNPTTYGQEMEIYTGASAIYVSSFLVEDRDVPAATVAGALRPYTRSADSQLRPPRRLSCREWRRVDRFFRRGMPRALRPAARCTDR